MQGNKGTKDMEHRLFEGYVLCASQTGIDLSDEVSMSQKLWYSFHLFIGKEGQPCCIIFLHSRLILMRNW